MPMNWYKLPKSEQAPYFKTLEPDIKKMDGRVGFEFTPLGDDTTLFP